jgi:hypothetical protein
MVSVFQWSVHAGILSVSNSSMNLRLDRPNFNLKEPWAGELYKVSLSGLWFFVNILDEVCHQIQKNMNSFCTRF